MGALFTLGSAVPRICPIALRKKREFGWCVIVFGWKERSRQKVVMESS